MDYENPSITDYGDLKDLTLGCLGGVEDDTFGDVINFPAHPSGALICP
jgi:hypothetical protein